jgi:flagellar M-ring protein FliF
VPGTASNLPRPTSQPSRARGGASRRTESVTYQSSRVVKQLHIPRGAVKRISLAVLVDQGVVWQGSGAKKQKVLVPPSAERMKSIRDVVASVAGLNTQRGDQLTIETLPFESTLSAEPPPPAASPASKELVFWDTLSRNKTYLMMVTAAVAGLLLFVRGLLYVVFRGRRKRGKVVVQEPPAALEEGAAARMPVAGAASSEGRELPRPAAVDRQIQPGPTASKGVAGLEPDRHESLVVALRESVRGNAELSATIVRRWLSENEG